MEEEEIKGSEFKVTIVGEDFPTFSLNITQQILELQKDRASEEKIQEQTPAQKQSLKRKVLDYSKGTIERGVKERKRAERDRDDSDFVYPKQRKKINEHPLPQPATETSATGFDNEQISDTQPKTRELTETIAYRILQPHQ